MINYTAVFMQLVISTLAGCVLLIFINPNGNEHNKQKAFGK
jgi:hypothetical protein